MRSLFATLRTLVLPGGAGSGTARLVLGPDLPPPLDTYLFAGTTLASAAIIWHYPSAADDNYAFMAMAPVGDELLMVQGFVRQGFVIEFAAGDPGGIQWSADFMSAALPDMFMIGQTHFVGDVLFAGESIVDQQPWTPTWGSTGGGFAMGASISDGRYRKQGDQMWALARLTLGAGFALGAGNLQVTDVPPGGDPNFSYQFLGGFARDTSVPAHFPIGARVMSTGTGVLGEELSILATGAPVTAVAPIAAPAAGDIYQIVGVYGTT